MENLKINSSNNPASANGLTVGVLEENVGNILQRGGEELALEKVSDRFTIRAASPNIDLGQQFPVYHFQQISKKSALKELIVAPDEREKAMQVARDSEEVLFASHVYQLKENVQTLLYLTEQITIKFAANVDRIYGETIASFFGLKLLKELADIPNAFVFKVTQQAQENPIKIANRLIRYPEVLIAEPNIVVRKELHYRPKDNLYPQQWYLNNNGGEELAAGSHIYAEKAWDITRGDRSIIVAVTDDSFDLNHPDFQGQGKIVAPKDFQDRDFLPLPQGSEPSHGTACAGIAIAEETGRGIVGVAPGCALMPIRTSGYVDDETLDQLFDWAITNGASVISCSWGPASVYFPLSLRQSAAINRAATKGRNGKGCVIVFAAGNANRPISGVVNERGWENNLLAGPTQWLGGFTVHPDVITVSAITSLNKKAAYSNWGNNVSVCAPSNNAAPGMWFEKTGTITTAPSIAATLSGIGVFTTDQLGAAGYDNKDFTSDFGGTSSACPMVAGVAALILSANPNLTAFEVKQIIQETADKVVDLDPDPQLGLKLGSYDRNGYSQWFGYGKVNAFNAVLAAQKKQIKPSQSGLLYGENNNSVAIPDNDFSGVESAIAIGIASSAASSRVLDIEVSVNIEHSFLGDLEISLRSPNGQTVLLQGRTLGCATQLQTIYSLQNTPALKQLVNVNAIGIWHLRVVDYVEFDTGRLKSWELTLNV